MTDVLGDQEKKLVGHYLISNTWNLNLTIQRKPYVKQFETIAYF